MRFAHLADTHLGYRQYGLYEREKDYYNVFEEIVTSIVQERPDFVIHSGDLFEFSRPPTQALLHVQKGFLAFKDAGIPIYAVPGNHDTVMRKNALPPQLLFKEFGLKVLSSNHPYFNHEDIFLGGSPYVSKYHSASLEDCLKQLEKASQNYAKSILILHQGIDKYLPFEYELELAQIPETFDYYAMGHIHNRILDDFGEGKMAYPGSTDIWKLDEVGNYQKKGKGYYLVDLAGDLLDVEAVNLDLPREFIQKEMEYSQRKAEIEQLKKEILKLPQKPVLHLTVKGGNFSRVEAFEELNKAFSDLVLTMRPNFQIESLENEKILRKGHSLDVKSMLRERLSDLDSELVTNLALELLQEIGEGRLENAEELTHKFYEELYDH